MKAADRAFVRAELDKGVGSGAEAALDTFRHLVVFDASFTDLSCPGLGIGRGALGSPGDHGVDGDRGWGRSAVTSTWFGNVRNQRTLGKEADT